ncbi:MAG: glycosyltransferase [Chryseolinea sp.]
MTIIVEAAVGIFFTFYVVVICALLIGWKKAQGMSPTACHQPTRSNECTLVSVVIAARNEANTLPFLIHDLQQQQGCRFEVIIVDDGSEDNTIANTRQSINDDPRFTILPSTQAGKKSALSLGVHHANGTIILTTDADCRVGANWIANMTSAFIDPSTMLVFGPVRIAGTTPFDELQAIEFSTLVGTAAATLAISRPTMCNGANLSYRKAAFINVGGYTGDIGIPSGDDEFLMRKILKIYPESVRYCSAQEAWVATAPSETIKAFFHQRVRWAGKWKFNESPTSLLLAGFVFLFHLMVVAIPCLLVMKLVSPTIAVAALAGKAVFELIFVNTVRLALGIRWNWLAFAGLQLFLQLLCCHCGNQQSLR